MVFIIVMMINSSKYEQFVYNKENMKVSTEFYELVAKYNNYIMNFTRYRVNAWNFKSNKKYYPVWVPVPTSPTSIFNHNSKYTYTYNKLFLDLVREYGLRIR